MPNFIDVTERNVSLPLIRTNPKLTSNVKLTVDSSGSLWLNSIDATEELANQRYKKFAVNEGSSHEVNLYRFYDFGKTPTKISFSLGTTVNTAASAKDLKDQFDFGFYTSGARYLSSRQYTGKFAYLAPIYLDSVIPQRFVIFKVPGASNYSADEGRNLFSNIDQSTFSTDFFKDAKVVASFDMGPDSKIGKYLESIIKNPMFNPDPLYVNFRSGGYSVYRGASISAGTYVEIPERLDTFFTQSLPQLNVEQYITEGFERNNIVHPRIMNLEFLFDDTTSDEYTFNRYIGIYCNEIELDQFRLDLNKMYENSISEDNINDQIFPKNYLQSDDEYFRLSNENGVKLYGYGLTNQLNDLNLNRTNSDSLFFPYIKTRDSQIHLIQPNGWEQDLTRVTLTVDDLELNLGSAFGPTTLITQENVTVSNENTRSTVRIKITDQPQHLDTIRLYHPSGANSDDNGRYDDLIFTSGYLDPSIPYTISSSIYINSDMNLDLISKAIADAVARIPHVSVFGIQMDTNVFLQARKHGSTYGTLKVKVTQGGTAIEVNGTVTDNIVYADGGFLGETHPILPYGNAERLEQKIEDIAIKTNKGWSTISRVCPSADLIKPNLSLADQAAAIDAYEKTEVIMVTDPGEIVDVSYNRIEVRELYTLKVGVLSMFEICDFDFSTYVSSYARNLDLDLYKDFFVPEGSKIIDFTKYTYKVVGDGVVEINNLQYSSSDQYIWQTTTVPSSYRIINGSPVLIKNSLLPDLVNTRLDLSYNDETNEATDYVGPFSLKAYHSVPDKNSKTYEYKDKFLYGNVLSEYNVYLENFTEYFSREGRVVPYISKWGIMDSSDCRDNFYRLNSDIMFGKNNFGPSSNEILPTPEKLTHEWFYIESDFEYSLDTELIKSNFSYFKEPFRVDDFIADPEYFDNYFTYVPTVNGVEVDRPQFRYSAVYKNRFTGNYETVFKGAKYILYETDRNGTRTNQTDRLKDYRFTVLLKPIPETLYESRKPINFRVLENVESKSIVVLIEMVIGHKALIPSTMFLSGWGTAGSSGTSGLDYIDQSTLFTNFFYGETNSYSIDYFISVPSLTQYNAMVSGLIPMIGASLGQTVAVTYYDSLTSTGYTSIISTGENDVYLTIKSGLILSGDEINSAYTCTVYPSAIAQLTSGTYQATRIEIIDSAVLTDSTFTVNRNIPYFDSMIGDYRIEFNDNGVSNLTHSFMYYSKHKKYNNKREAYSTIKLSRGVDLSVSGLFPGFTALNTVRMVGLENYDSQVNSEINQVINDFAPIYIVNEGSRKLLVQLNSTSFGSSVDLADSTVTDDGLVGATQTTITLSPNSTSNYALVGQPPIITNPLTYTVPMYPFGTTGVWLSPSTAYYTIDALPSSTTEVWRRAVAQLQIFGGLNYHEKLFQGVSFAKFAQILRTDKRLVSWETYSNGSLSSIQKFSMETDEAEMIEKSTISKIDPIYVTVNQVNGVAGFSITEVPSTEYEVYRYSGEYDVILKPVSGFKYYFSINDQNITGSNCCFNTKSTNFFVIPDFEFVKYSQKTILDLENSQNYRSVYPYIYESAIDRAPYNVLASSWDYGYHFEYADKRNKTRVAGTKRIAEDYSFVSKLLNLPNQLTLEDFSIAEVSNLAFNNSDFGQNTLIYSAFNNEIRFKINLPEVMTKFLSDTGIRAEFQKFFIYLDNSQIIRDSDLLGQISFEEFLKNYCLQNLVNLYQVGSFEFYQLDDRTIAKNRVVFNQVPASQLAELGYSITNAVKINNTKTSIIEGSLMVKPSSGIKLVPKIKMQYI